MNTIVPEQFVFPHAVDSVEVIETHISWVLLTGRWAYKIKKPVRFDFVDYSTLQRRHAMCDKELEINKRLAPEIYQAVVPISRSADGANLLVGDGRDVVEYALQMRQFDQRDLMSRALSEGRVTLEMIDEFAHSLAAFHQKADVLPSARHESYRTHVYRDVLDNFETLRSIWPQLAQDDRFRFLEDWTLAEYRRIEDSIERRMQRQRVRHCHGDLHCGNIVLVANRLVPFDAIEFNEDLTWIDTMNELAFPAMDLMIRGRRRLANRLVNAYLEAAVDYEGGALLPFFQVYRAMVRAKVAALNPANQARLTAGPWAPDAPWTSYLDTARQMANRRVGALIITHGVSGSGKSWLAQHIADATGAIRIRSDVLRRSLHIDSPEQRYAPQTTDRIYQQLAADTERLIRSGFSVIADATFLKQRHRKIFEDLAGRLQVLFFVVEARATNEEIFRRLAQRRNDPSEANRDVVVQQMKTMEPLSDREREHGATADSVIQLIQERQPSAAP